MTVDSVNQVIDELDDDEKHMCRIRTPEGYQDELVISESGFYALALISPIPEAKVFKRWITREILPAIRKTGRYEIGPEQHGIFDAIKQMCEAMPTQESQVHPHED